MNATYDILLIIQTIVVLFLIGIILVQRSDSDGFGASGGGNQFMTGRASANLVTRTTALLATAFIIISLILANMSGHKGGKSIVDIDQPAASTTGAVPLPGSDSTDEGFMKLQEKTTAPLETPAAEPKKSSVPKPE